MLNLLHQHQEVALNTSERRIKLLRQPLIPRSHITYQDWLLAGSLSALHQQGFMPSQPEEKPAAAFLHTWLLLQSQGPQALEAIACLFDTVSDKPKIQHALRMALRCAALNITDTEIPDSISHDFCTLLANEVINLPQDLLRHWLTSGKDSLQAAALEQLAIQQPGASDWLRPFYTEDNPPETRIKALTLAASYQDTLAIQQLKTLDDKTLEKDSVTLLAAWFHPDIYRNRGLKASALTGHINCVPDLLSALEQPQQARVAEQAWLWLTGQRLPHMPPVTSVNANQPHTSPKQNTLPDARLAHEWWQKQKWDENQRYFMGQPITESRLQQLFKHYCGQASQLICTHLGRSQSRTITEPYGLWLDSPGGL